jgi:hypothetical protein
MKSKIIKYLFVSFLLLIFLGFYYYQRNSYSKEVVRLEILGKEEVQAFDEIEYAVKYKNNGNIVLEDAELTFKFPENSLPSSGYQQIISQPVEDIYPGEENTIFFKGRLVGKEGEIKKAEAVLRYRPRNLKAFFESSTTFSSRIKSVPLVFETDFPSKIESGKDINFSLNYFSNSDWPISNLRVRVEYPLGFEFVSSRPAALEKTEWDLPVINKAEGGRIDIKGKVFGDQKEQKTIKASIGLVQGGSFLVLKELTKTSEIIRPNIALFQHINNNQDYVANLGDSLHYEIFFRNLSDEPFQNLFLIATLESDLFDFDSLKTENGQINKEEKSILWDWRSIPELRFLAPGEEGRIDFWVSLKRDIPNFERNNNLSLRNKVVLSQVREVFETKVNTRLVLNQKAYIADEIFQSGGSIPPKVGQTTYYTIVWEVKNYYNDVRSVKVRAVLPPYIRLTGKVFPENSPLTFDSESKEVIWNIDKLSAGTGVNNNPLTLAFQIAFVPDISQIGQIPIIVGEALISGKDDWTGAKVQFVAPALTTSLSETDTGSGMVQN